MASDAPAQLPRTVTLPVRGGALIATLWGEAIELERGLSLLAIAESNIDAESVNASWDALAGWLHGSVTVKRVVGLQDGHSTPTLLDALILAAHTRTAHETFARLQLIVEAAAEDDVNALWDDARAPILQALLGSVLADLDEHEGAAREWLATRLPPGLV